VIKALLLFVILLTQSVTVLADRWSSSDLRLEVGSLISEEQYLTLAANPSGQILVSVPVEGLSLDANYIVSLNFSGQPPEQIFIVWQTDTSDQFYQKGFYSLGSRDPSIDMKGTEGWSGTAKSLEFGFITQPGIKVKLREARLYQPGLADYLGDVLNNWSELRRWQLFDINMHTGARQSYSGPFPAPFFAALCLVFLAIYIMVYRGSVSWKAVGLIIFCAWLALDSFWHVKLWYRVIETTDRYGDLNVEQKALSSEYAPYAKFAGSVQRIIDRAGARVFVAGSRDYEAMSTAYYLSPINTFWHRNGPELPDAKYLRAGDYIALLRANNVNYQPGIGAIVLIDNSQIKVQKRLSHDVGILLEVL
jgi:hypothetical protein